MPTVSIAERLAVYGLKAPPEGQLKDLRVKRGQQVSLNQRQPPPEAHVALARPGSLDELKRMVGVPDKALEKPRRAVSLNLPKVTTSSIRRISREQNLTFGRAVETFVYSHSRSVSEIDRLALTILYQIVVVSVPVFVFKDVFVSAGSSLSLEQGSVLLAGKVTVEAGGRIFAGKNSSINCQSFTGL
jgi:hypothetical protein